MMRVLRRLRVAFKSDKRLVAETQERMRHLGF